MRTVELSTGVHIAVQDVGAGPVVVLIAGFALTHELWDRQVRVLAEKGHRVVCVDLRGHGDSDAPLDGYDVAALADEVTAVLDAVDVRSCVLVGHSFGGLVAFRMAARSPRRVTRLVLVGSNGVAACRTENFPFGRPGPALLARVVEAEHAGRVPARRAALVASFATGPAPDAAVIDWLMSMSLQMPSWAAIACFRSLFTCDHVADLPSVTMPVVQVVGLADPVHSFKGAAWLQERLPDAHLVEIAASGHYPMLETPDEFDHVLLAALGHEAIEITPAG
ncbi:alpha/beta hydrolase [Pseudonocardia xishanensis]|uniref:AB hydrolase-1 domain-containing protein n=1 Tax=Pseudonocardia xishanensis TaxID=630995 RepID=A0ABP8RPV0_9PSEU